MQHLGEGTLDIPATWHNSSVNIFTAQVPGLKGVSITVNRDRLVLGQTLSAYVHEQTEKLRAQLRGFRLLERTMRSGETQQREFLEFTWDSPDVGPVHQLLLCVLLDQTVLNIAATSPGAVSGEQREVLLGILQSFTPTQLPS